MLQVQVGGPSECLASLTWVLAQTQYLSEDADDQYTFQGRPERVKPPVLRFSKRLRSMDQLLDPTQACGTCHCSSNA